MGGGCQARCPRRPAVLPTRRQTSSGDLLMNLNELLLLEQSQVRGPVAQIAHGEYVSCTHFPAPQLLQQRSRHLCARIP